MANVVDEYKDLPSDEIKEIYHSKSRPCAVCCLNLKGDINIGMIIRTATIFEFSKVYTVGKRFYDRRGSVGMQNYIDIDRRSCTSGDQNETLDHSKVISFLEEMKTLYTIVFVEQGGEDIRNIKTILADKLPPLFVMGAEDYGIPDEILKYTPSIRISIPQAGICRSFNVSTAFSIVSWEYTK